MALKFVYKLHIGNGYSSWSLLGFKCVVGWYEINKSMKQERDARSQFHSIISLSLLAMTALSTFKAILWISGKVNDFGFFCGHLLPTCWSATSTLGYLADNLSHLHNLSLCQRRLENDDKWLHKHTTYNILVDAWHIIRKFIYFSQNQSKHSRTESWRLMPGYNSLLTSSEIAWNNWYRKS